MSRHRQTDLSFMEGVMSKFHTLLMFIVSLSPGLTFASNSAVRPTEILSHYDHELHQQKVFAPQGITCNECHYIQVDPTTKKARPEPGFELASVRRSFKEICHNCHQSRDPKNLTAPQGCFTCHQSIENFDAIKPQNHLFIGWNRSHAINARIDGDSCQSCHTNSQCVQCHLRRNDIIPQVHTRNFRYYHSVEARTHPYSCDACHSKSFCTDCHIGRAP